MFSYLISLPFRQYHSKFPQSGHIQNRVPPVHNPSHSVRAGSGCVSKQGLALYQGKRGSFFWRIQRSSQIKQPRGPRADLKRDGLPGFIEKIFGNYHINFRNTDKKQGLCRSHWKRFFAPIPLSHSETRAHKFAVRLPRDRQSLCARANKQPTWIVAKGLLLHYKLYLC